MEKHSANMLAATLAWQIDAGADELVADLPQDRFAESRARAAAQTAPAVAQPEPTTATPPAEAPISKAPTTTAAPTPVPTASSKVTASAPPSPSPTPRPTAAPPAPAASSPASQSGSAAALSARELAQGCETIEDIIAAIGQFDGCGLKRTATNTVVCDGDPQARLIFVGEAPGADEDRQGLPFVGAAGQLLNRMLGAINQQREQCYITNILNWRPPGNRAPTLEEIAICQPFVERQIAIIKPDVVVLLGGIAAKALLNEKQGITRLRGKWRQLEIAGLLAPVDVMPTFHPAYLLRQPAAKREAWQDLQAIEKRLGTNG
jgi:uracil-DNA glycosylase